MVGAGAAEQLARSLGHPVPAVQRSALAALVPLSADGEACQAIVRADGVALLGGMLAHAMDDSVQENVLSILQQLLDHEDSSMATGRELLFGSLSALVGVLRSQNTHVQRAALPMLRLLVIFDEQGRELIGASGATEHLIRRPRTRATRSTRSRSSPPSTTPTPQDTRVRRPLTIDTNPQLVAAQRQVICGVFNVFK